MTLRRRADVEVHVHQHCDGCGCGGCAWLIVILALFGAITSLLGIG